MADVAQMAAVFDEMSPPGLASDRHGVQQREVDKFKAQILQVRGSGRRAVSFWAETGSAVVLKQRSMQRRSSQYFCEGSGPL